MKGMPYRLSICGKQEINAFARQGMTHLLSIEDPTTPLETPEWFIGIHQQLHFHDVESVEDALELKMVPPTRDDVALILNLGAQCLEVRNPQSLHLLIHCYAGASRSTAASYALFCQALGAGRESEALDLVVGLRPRAFPNFLMVRYADELLNRGGAMIEALGPLRKSFNRMVNEWIAGQPPKEVP